MDDNTGAGLMSSMCAPNRRFFIAAAIGFLATPSFLGATQLADESSLPFAGTDIIAVLQADGRERQFGGRIEDIRGETLTLRRNGKSKIELYRMPSVTSLYFAKPAEWDKGLEHIESGEFRRGLEYLDKALRAEKRQWAWNELQASAAQTCIKIGRRKEAVERIEKVFEEDERSRHVSILPLVWDSRLPDDERIDCEIEQLGDKSILRRLVACSALLHKKELRTSIQKQLTEIRRNSGLVRISELAESQLWRIYLLENDNKKPLLNHWCDLVNQMPPTSRGGPAFVLGRLQAKAHKYDDAALSFLWMPTMSPIDQALSAQSLFQASQCLRNAGRVREAENLKHELQSRFPETSAALQNNEPEHSTSR